MKLDDIIANKRDIALIKIMKFKIAIIFSNGSNQKIIPKLSDIAISSLINEGIPIVDFTKLSKSQIDTLAALLPIPSLLPDPAPYGPMSKSPISVFIFISRKIGADVHNSECIDYPSFLFKKDMESEMSLFNMMIDKNMSISEARHKTRLDKNLEEVQKKITCRASDSSKLAIERINAVLSYYSSPLVEDFAWMCIGLIQEMILLEMYSSSSIDMPSRVDALKNNFSALSKESFPKERSVIMKMIESIEELCSPEYEDLIIKRLH